MNTEEQIYKLNQKILQVSGEIVDKQRELQQLQYQLQNLTEGNKNSHLQLLED